ncbi:MAG: 2-oxoglutarate dehydrogenase E1 component [Gammaproteobacteria bacterium]|nr:2-oxoglutarate dehydrogenase E1 component [Gammaproteobacteria bacterium]
MSHIDSIKDRQANSYLADGNADYLEMLYEQFLANPDAVSPTWKHYFQSIQPAPTDALHQQIRNTVATWSKRRSNAPSLGTVDNLKQARVWNYIDAYRTYGHFAAHLDPLNLINPTLPEQLTFAFHGLNQDDLQSTFDTDGLSNTPLTLAAIQTLLEKIYCHHIGFEYKYIDNEEEIRWLQQQIEQAEGCPKLLPNAQRHILNRLTAAEGLEKYLASKYVGQKRFGLEGGESLIPLIDELVQRSSLQGANEIIIGMAHRGRLNLLVNIMGRPPKDLFQEFEGKKNHDRTRSGDVKYHLGFSSDIQAQGGPMHLAMAFNPSHLEIIAPVVQGSVRARQQYWHDVKRNQIIPIQIHGDAAFAGQGVVMETLNLSQVRGFTIGGTLHIVLNNQVGFTISDPRDARSTFYCTDVAKMVNAPIFHVNADDPEAVVFTARLAAEYRMKFNRDVVIDLVCYRRHGHNEADEPAATQPIMYQHIKQHPTTLALYIEQLISENLLTKEDADKLALIYRDALDQGEVVLQTLEPSKASRPRLDWSPYFEQQWTAPSDTRVSLDTLKTLGEHLEQLPAGFTLQPQVNKVMEERKKMMEGQIPLNWGCAEALAFASLLDEGHAIRLSGQDSRRGTFAHRHATLHDFKTGQSYTPLEHLEPKQASFSVVDSVLSEEAVLGFEYGYASTLPDALVLWEAQYGDFANGAQVVIDQFISSADQKWGRLCGLTLLLPHGYEGSGPEHSSARLERYLQLCAQQNMQVCNLTTPAQIFHVLRRQVKRPFRKPLIIMSPKSLLRHKLATSTLDELAQGKFEVVLPEVDQLDSEKITRVIICSGKVYYDLLEKRREAKLQHIAILRIEQLYPFPTTELVAQLSLYPRATDVVWCQEEPKNQGAWYCIHHRLIAAIKKDQTLSYAGRDASASPAAGYMSLHLEQQAALVKQALGI